MSIAEQEAVLEQNGASEGTGSMQLVSFRLAEEEELRHDFAVKLPYNAASGRQDIRMDFDVQAEQRYQFSVYRKMDIGFGDIDVEIVAQRDGKGGLDVQQTFINETDTPVSFRCQLYAPDRRRLKND